MNATSFCIVAVANNVYRMTKSKKKSKDTSKNKSKKSASKAALPRNESKVAPKTSKAGADMTQKVEVNRQALNQLIEMVEVFFIFLTFWEVLS